MSTIYSPIMLHVVRVPNHQEGLIIAASHRGVPLCCIPSQIPPLDLSLHSANKMQLVFCVLYLSSFPHCERAQLGGRSHSVLISPKVGLS